MKLIIEIPFEAYYTFKNDLGKGNLNALGEIIANGKPYEEKPQSELAVKVWELYEKNQSHLATRVIEFGDELKELLGEYQNGGGQKEDCGKWIFHKYFNAGCRYGCNQCGNLANVPSNFCPNCGKRMKKYEKGGAT